MTVSASLFGGLEEKRQRKARAQKAQLAEKWKQSRAQIISGILEGIGRLLFSQT